ncbi:hypothetical protein ACFL6C_06650 [Myxococcota bacterium]
MRRTLTLTLLVASAACRVNHISREGPAPKPTAVVRSETGFPPDAVLCSPQGGVITIEGDGFSPMPRKVLTDEVTAEMPTVILVSGDNRIELTSVTYDPGTGFLTAVVPPNTPAGTYDIVVTNPNGNAGSINAALEITPSCATLALCTSVDPAFGWINGRTRIEICADNTGAGGFVPVPEAFILVDPDDDGENVTTVPLIREAFVNASDDLTETGGPADASVMSAVVPSALEERGQGLVLPDTPGTAYAIKVVNPDGATGFIYNAFELLPDHPPVLTRISPDQSLVNQGSKTLTIEGEYLKDPTNGTTARILLLTAAQEVGAACAEPSCYECSGGTPVEPSPPAETYANVTCDVDTSAVPTGAYVVRYEHLDDSSFSDLASFVLTNPSGKLSSVPVFMLGELGTPRFGLGAALGQDDLGNRFLYAVGGQTDAGAENALDTVEVAALSRFGAVTSWTEVPEKLPAPLTGLSVIAHDNYLFALGGRNSDGEPVSTVYRARVLGADSAPFIRAPEAVAGGSLTAGTYSYKVSALLGPGTDNHGGESLPSDAETIRVGGNAGSLKLTWDPVPGASGYRIYRTRGPNQLVGTEQFAKEVGNVTSYTDGGDAVAQDAGVPQPAGATGKWMSMDDLALARADAGATIATWVDTNESPAVTHFYVYVVAGQAMDGSYLASYDSAELVQDTTTGIWSTTSFATGTQSLAIGRSELIVATLDERAAPRIAPSMDAWVVASTGTDGTDVYGDIQYAKVGTEGQLVAWEVADVDSGSSPRFGASGTIANNLLYSISGQSSSNYLEKGVRGEICAVSGCDSTDPPPLEWAGGDAGITIPSGQARYRAGCVYSAGFFYFIGGQSDGTTAFGTVFRGGY